MRVFAGVGYARATTNAIASEAGISVGSLYQFFANKEDIAEALEKRYADRLAATRDWATSSRSDDTLDVRIGRLIDAIVAISSDSPGFNALFAERPLSAEVARAAHSHHAAFVAVVDSILGDTAPSMPEADRSRVTMVATQICRALMPNIVAAAQPERDQLVRELKQALTGYLEGRAAGYDG